MALTSGLVVLLTDLVVVLEDLSSPGALSAERTPVPGSLFFYLFYHRSPPSPASVPPPTGFFFFFRLQG